jgi:predicted amino acid-binding ACT domain protein
MPDDPVKGVHEGIVDDIAALTAKIAELEVQIDNIEAKVVDIWTKYMPT